MPKLHYNKKKEDEKAQVKREKCSVEGFQNVATYIT
jgi:hypothetical protein